MALSAQVRGARVLCVALLPLLLAAATRPANAQPDSPENPLRSAAAARSPSVGVDWPAFLGPTSDGKSTETGILTDWSGAALKTLWYAPLGTSYGIGSVAQGRYFQFDRVADQERLRCLDARTGAELWSQSQAVRYSDMYGYNNGPRSSPTIRGELVYTYGVAGRLTCRRVSDGQMLWTVDAHQKYGVIQNFFGVGCSPVIHDDLVIVMVGGSPEEDQQIAYGALDRVSPNGSALVAFDARSGKQRWQAGDYLASYSTPRTMQIDGKTILLAFVREGLLAVDPADGRELWFYPWRSPRLESVNAAVPVVFGNRVLISECYDIGSVVLEVSLEGAEVIWKDSPRSRQQAFRAHWATPIEIAGKLYGSSGRNEPDSDLRCIDLAAGQPLWVDSRRIRSSLLSVDQHLVVLDEDGRMQLLRATPGQLEVVTELDLAVAAEDRPALSPPCWAAPILSHGLLYVRGRDHVLCMQLIAKGS